MKSKLFMALVAVFLALPLIAAYGQCGPDTGVRDTIRIEPVVVTTVTPGQTIAVPIYLYSDQPITGASFGFKWSAPNNIRYASFTLGQLLLDLEFEKAPVYRFDTTQGIVGVGFYTLDTNNPIPANTSGQGVQIGTLTFMTRTGASADVISVDSIKFGPEGYFVITDGATSSDICPEFVNSPIGADIRLPVQEFDGPVLPEAYSISQNNPNPFNPTTSIDFALPTAAKTKIEVFNILGQKVKTLVDEYLTAGNKRVDWDGTDDRGSAVASGIYLYRITANDFTETKKMMLMK